MKEHNIQQKTLQISTMLLVLLFKVRHCIERQFETSFRFVGLYGEQVYVSLCTFQVLVVTTQKAHLLISAS
jgi:hypothetical protein